MKSKISFLITSLVLSTFSYCQIMTTIAGTGSFTDSGDSGLATLANISEPQYICFDKLGNLYIAEGILPGFRKIDKNGIITTPIKFNKAIIGITLNNNGDLYLCSDNVMKIDSSNKVISIAGGGTSTASGISAIQEKFNVVEGMIFDEIKTLYIADLYRVMKLDSNGIITTISGTYGIYGYNGDNGPAKYALFFSIGDIKFDKKGNLFICDEGNNVIRKIDTSGIITTVVGTGIAGFSGDNDSAINATINQPTGLAFDNFGNLYISDQGNNRIRKVDTNGIISTYAGSGKYGNLDGPALQSTLNYPMGIAFDSADNLYIADYGNNLIRKVTPAVLPVTFLSFNVQGFKSFNGNTNTLVNWETASEINTAYFNIQRSTDGISFETIGKVKAKGISIYTFNDQSPLWGGLLYYRLEIVDNNGSITYSDVKELSIINYQLSIAPNPAKDYITVIGSNITGNY